MGRLTTATLLLVMTSASAMAADDPLAKARSLYNQRQFEAAVNAAEQARLKPESANAADLVAARAYLERYRESAAAGDLANARDRLRRLDPLRFAPRERVEYVVGLGETLFFDGAFGAAATVFDSVLQGGALLTDAVLRPAQGAVSVSSHERESVLDWWATAMDRDTKLRPEAERHGGFQRIGLRMEDELATHPGSGAASYWLAAAAQARGDSMGAWDAAQAGWVRAPLASDRGEALRADLDRLVLRAIVPDRAKATAQPPETLRAEWERFKERWRR